MKNKLGISQSLEIWAWGRRWGETGWRVRRLGTITASYHDFLQERHGLVGR